MPPPLRKESEVAESTAHSTEEAHGKPPVRRRAADADPCAPPDGPIVVMMLPVGPRHARGPRGSTQPLWRPSPDVLMRKLMRIVMCLSLILQGSAWAVTSSYWDNSPSPPQMTTAEHCHGHDGATMTDGADAPAHTAVAASATAGAASADPESSTDPSPAKPCCPDNACRCMSAPSFAFAPRVWLPSPKDPYVARVRVVTSAYASPVLPGLIRPPIR